ncbi:MAG: HEPN domain-containing protein [bacterium]|nr:HEPN domain-containing protein [bacterium]
MIRKFNFPENTFKKELENAEHHLENGIKCISNNMLDLAIVSIYTSMFHASRSILFRDNFKERSHICLKIYIDEKYSELSEFTRIFNAFRKNRITCCMAWKFLQVSRTLKKG